MNNKLDYKYFYKRNLPHFQPEEGIFFITFRLNIELPDNLKQTLISKHKDFEEKIKKYSELEKSEMKLKFDKRQFDLIDNFLGLTKNGPFWLKDENIAKIVKDSLFFLHKEKYFLYSFCIMPNHVHILIKPLQNVKKGYFSFAEIMKSHKGITANKANKYLNRKGQFWHHENYDHWVRDDKEFHNIIWYIINNPVKAKLVKDFQDWKFTWVEESIQKEMGIELHNQD